ncbi:MAG: UDP-N-acetylglucosamine 2-epimerase, partial [Cyanobacteriota bacterium]
LSKLYKINLLVSGTHLEKNWNTKTEILQMIKPDNSTGNINVIEISADDRIESFEYTSLLPSISKSFLNYRNNTTDQIKFCLFLGDRIETAAYAITAMYLENILIHICGGDIGDIAHFDHNIRHVLTKISHLHLVTNQQSFNVVKQLGEEEWRICNIGMPSLDIAKSQISLTKDELKHKLNLTSDNLIIATYHPDHYSSDEEILSRFKTMIEGLNDLDYQVILTYPNNDPGYKVILEEIEQNVTRIKNIKIIKNLGIKLYTNLLNSLNVILIGNTSSIVLESSFFKVPSLLLGPRQSGRLRGKNVSELIEFSSSDIKTFVINNFKNYENLKETFSKNEYIYGDGQSVEKTIIYLDTVFKNYSIKKLLSKKFSFPL